ncbi:pentapeptide repeat-containing protein [Streptomyces lydicus]|uniref:pentapeptide repeat-containing protein n=1 Tax=Streptomyces lydicus TaxID=47763 RepID=UPI0036F9F530
MTKNLGMGRLRRIADRYTAGQNRQKRARRFATGAPAGGDRMQWVGLVAVSLPGLAALAALLFTWMQVGQASEELRISEQGQTADLREADLAKADLHGAGLSGADFRDAWLPGATLTKATLSGTDLSGARLLDANLTKVACDTSLVDPETGKVVPMCPDLTGAHMNGVKLVGAYLATAKLRDADLTGADLTGANLTGADLTDAYLAGANLTRADLTGARLKGV